MSTDNPFAPPTTDAYGAPVASGAPDLAPVGNRFLGLLLDGFLQAGLAVVGVVIGFIVAGAAGLPIEGDGPDEVGPGMWLAMLFAVLFIFPLMLVQWYLIGTRGQSIAKILLKMRIVKLDGSPCGFVSGVLLRVIAFGVLSGLVQILSCFLLGWVVTLVDGGMVFRDDRRTLHDHLAGTMVVEA